MANEVDLELFKLTVENSYNHIIITEVDGTIIYANPAVEKTTGFSREEVVGQKPSLWGKQMPASFYKKMWDTILKDKKPFVGELTNKRKNGEYYEAEALISPILGEDGEVRNLMGIERDITEIKEAERMKSEFVSIASHQLKTPLTSIQWYIEMLLGGDIGQVSDKQKKVLDDMMEGTQSMRELVSDLLNVSRIESGKMEITTKEEDLDELIAEIIHGVRTFSQKENCKVEFVKPSSDLPKVKIDRSLFKQVVHNLLTNAIRYSPKDSCAVKVELKEEGSDYVISVSDKGMGIPKEAQKRIFERFYRAENASKHTSEGTGLGLYINKLIVEAYGGRIWFESEVGKGTTFYITIPKSGMVEKKGEKKLM